MSPSSLQCARDQGAPAVTRNCQSAAKKSGTQSAVQRNTAENGSGTLNSYRRIPAQAQRPMSTVDCLTLGPSTRNRSVLGHVSWRRRRMVPAWQLFNPIGLYPFMWLCWAHRWKCAHRPDRCARPGLAWNNRCRARRGRALARRLEHLQYRHPIRIRHLGQHGRPSKNRPPMNHEMLIRESRWSSAF